MTENSEAPDAVGGGRVFLLGAGASREAGAPLATELVPSIVEMLAGNYKIHNVSDLLSGRRFGRLLAALVADSSWAELAGVDVRDAEQLLSLIDTAEVLGIRFPTHIDGMYADADYMRRMLVWAILMVLEHSISSDLPPQYGMFIQQLRPDDTIITLNYDTVIESSIWSSSSGGVDYGLPPGSLVLPTLFDHGFRVLKLHGSANWMRCDGDIRGTMGPPGAPCRRIFVSDLKRIHSHGGPSTAVCTCGNGGVEAYIVPPTFLKAFAGSPLERVWRVARDCLAVASELVIVGYSLPVTDLHVRHLLAFARVKNPKMAITLVNPDQRCLGRFGALTNASTFTYLPVGFGSYVSAQTAAED